MEAFAQALEVFWRIRFPEPRRALGLDNDPVVLQAAWSAALGEGAISEDLRAWRLRCLIFMGTGDVDFVEQARRAANEIPTHSSSRSRSVTTTAPSRQRKHSCSTPSSAHCAGTDKHGARGVRRVRAGDDRRTGHRWHGAEGGNRRLAGRVPPLWLRAGSRNGVPHRQGRRGPLVPIIFDLYANKRLGARAVACWLNRRGHRTKAGKPWSHTSVLTVLTNRAYIGEIFFRGRYHPAPHPRLVDPDLFEAARAVLEARSDDLSLRRTNGSDYLLTGLVVSEKCGKRFIGAAAKGNAYRYQYYVCFSRHRYGTQECDQDRVRAEELEERVVESLLATLERGDLLEQALGEWTELAEASRPKREKELARIESRSGMPRTPWTATSWRSKKATSARRSARRGSRSSPRNWLPSRLGDPISSRKSRRVRCRSPVPMSSASYGRRSSARSRTGVFPSARRRCRLLWPRSGSGTTRTSSRSSGYQFFDHRMDRCPRGEPNEGGDAPAGALVEVRATYSLPGAGGSTIKVRCAAVTEQDK